MNRCMKLTVIGAGTIGAGVAYNVALRDLFDEIRIVDLNEEKAQGEALDMSHAAATFSDTIIRQGSYEDADGSDVVAVTAGKPRKEGMTRADLLEVNAEIMDAIHDNEFGDDAVFVTTTNPMDPINYTHSIVSDYPRERFVGFGGWLDSARFQYVLAKQLDTAPSTTEGHVIGAHGETQVPVFSRVTVNGQSADIPDDDKPEIKEQIRQSAMDVISRKGGTQWAPTLGVAEVIDAIVRDEQRVIPCSAILDGEYGHKNVSIGVPCRLGRNGVEEIVEWDLTGSEQEAFDESAETLKEMCGEAEALL